MPLQNLWKKRFRTLKSSLALAQYYPWKKHRRNVQAALTLALNPTLGRGDIQKTLDLLTPYRTEHPLVRFGVESQDGYLLPDDLEGIVASFSPGVGPSMDFDINILERGIPTYLADASVDGLPEPHPLAHFEKKFIGPQTGGNVTTLDDWVGRNAPPEGDLLLQMDIEGAEYEALDATSENTLSRFRLILIELHQLHRIFRPRFHDRYHRVFEKLTKNHAVLHMHPNNFSPLVQAAGFDLPGTMEVTLMRRDRFTSASPETRFPHPLDEVTTPDRPDYPLPQFWSNPG